MMTIVQSFDAQVRVIHDHLYANANIRLPEDLQGEVAKVIQTITWLAVVDSLPRLDDKLVAGAMAGDREVCTPIAREVRDGFQSYNASMRRYPGKEQIRLDDASVAFIRAALVDVDMSDARRDWLGDALEVFRSTAAKRLGGQFFTDQHVTRLAIELLQYDPIEDDLVDICAGTGGFLIAGARVAQSRGLPEPPRLVGIEVDASLAHLANSTLHQLGCTEADPVFNADSFRSADQWPVSLRKSVIPGTHRCLATNPPFGQKITVKDPKVLGKYELGHVWRKDSKGWSITTKTSPTPPDILFLERNLMLAEPERGRVAIVVPYQALSGPKLGYVREWLLRNAYIEAVVDLPDVTFQPWTGTKTALLVARRRGQPLPRWEPEDYPVFMAVSQRIGHDRRGNPFVDASGRVICDLPEVAEAFSEYLRASEITSYDEAFVTSAIAFNAASDLRLNAAFHEPARMGAQALLLDADRFGCSTKTVADVTERIFFPGRFKRNYTDDSLGGVPFLGGTNVTQLLPTNKKYLEPTDSRLDDLRVRAGWILVTRSGSTGVVSSVPPAWDGFAMSEHVIRIVPDPEKLAPEYLEVFLRSQLGQSLLAQGIFGSVIDEITPEHIASMVIPIPQDASALARIVEEQATAAAARELAISSSLEALRLFEEVVGRHFVGVREDARVGLSNENVIDQSQELLEREVTLE